MREAAAADLARRAPLERAIDLHEVQVVFQPVVRLTDGATVGYEALARLGERGDAPGPWFQLARELGLGMELELTCLAAIAELGLPPDDALLFVNVGPATLLDPRMEALCGPLSDRLVVELTEHDEIDDYGALRPALERWSSRGVRLAVDDTGAGYSTLRHVLELAPHFLKLDRTVIGGLDDHAPRRALVAALVTFAGEVGTTIIAEGVERWEEAEALREAGVHLAQGFVFGRPDVTWQPARWPSAAEGDELHRRLGGARDLAEAGEIVCDHLAGRPGLLPSVYVERDGVLRCLAQRGYWQVLDGIPLTTGVMARCFRDGEVVVVIDVTDDTDFLEAIPDLRSQCSVPVLDKGVVVGVLSVESPGALSPDDIADTVAAAEALSDWMARRGDPVAEEPTPGLSRSVKALSGLTDERAIEDALVRQACAVSGMSSAVLIRPGPFAMLERRATHGPLALAFYALSTAELHRLRDRVATVSSVYTGMDAAGRARPSMEKLRVAGVGAIAAVPLRTDHGQDVGLLAVAHATPLAIDAHHIEALELLVAEASRALDLANTMEELRDRAARDPLTGLGNHRAFRESVRTRALAKGDWAVLTMDLDHFAAINENHGHVEGDRVLREVAGAMSQALSGGDRVFRVGGDEFAALLMQADLAAAAAIRERLAQAAEPALRWYDVSLSVGAAAHAANEPVSYTLSRAEADLHAAKRVRQRRI